MNILEHNPFKEKLDRGEVAFGFQLHTHSPAIAEAAGYCGFDWLYIDTEHTIADDSAVENVTRAAIAGNIVPVLRIPTHDAGRIGQFLDMGIAGLIFPHVDTAEQALAIVKAGKYPPLGERGAAFGNRASQYGLIGDRAEYIKRSNKNVSLIAMIENMEGVKNVEGILETGIDMLRIGLSDLSLSMGLGGEMNPDIKEYQDAVAHVIKCAKKRNVPVGAHSMTIDGTAKLVKQGFTMISYASDMGILVRSSKQELAQLRAIPQR